MHATAHIATRSSLHDSWVSVALALGLVALTVRSVGYAALWVTLAVGVIGLVVPAVASTRIDPGRWVAVTIAGVAAFVLVRLVWDAPGPQFAWVALAGNAAAGVAEEAFFRRGLYAWLLRWGVPVAVGGAAVAFALVHIPVYGWGSVPLNVAAGLVFGWQRWATGGWTAPAATHATANVIQIVG